VQRKKFCPELQSEAVEEGAEQSALSPEMRELVAANPIEVPSKKVFAGGQVVHLDLAKTHPYKPLPTIANTRTCVSALGYVCAFNEFQGRYLIHTKQEWLDVNDNMILELREQIIDNFGFEPSKDILRDVILARCLANRFNPILDYLYGLEWDGTSRIDGWLTIYLGVEDTALTRQIGRKFLCGLVRRAKQPGCKFDHVLVFEGEQGIGKSRALKTLVGGVGEEYFSDQSILDVPHKEQQELTGGAGCMSLRS
jgi:hypothetical protein